LRKLKGLAEEATETAQRIKAQTLWRESRREQTHEAAAPQLGHRRHSTINVPQFLQQQKRFRYFSFSLPFCFEFVLMVVFGGGAVG
jgi:hypothetical protein